MHPKDAVSRQDGQIAAGYLASARFLILDRNYRCADGEIHIATAGRPDLVACEAKARSDACNRNPAGAVTSRKLRWPRRLAAHWAATGGVFFGQLRAGTAGVIGSPSGDFTIEHLRGVG